MLKWGADSLDIPDDLRYTKGMRKNLPDKIYVDLENKILDIYLKANLAAKEAVGCIRTHAYRQIGKYIVQVEQKNNIRAQYGEQLLEKLAVKLTAKLGSGFSVSNIRYMRQFYLTHRIHQRVGELGWWQHVTLLSIKDPKQRQYYEKKAVRKGWTRNELIEVLRKERV